MEEKDIIKVRKLLQIADILDVYGYYLLRRGIGSFYIGIAATVSLGLIFFFSLKASGSTFIILATYALFFVFIFAMIMILGKQLLEIQPIYLTLPAQKERRKYRKYYGYSWILLSTVYLILIFMTTVHVISSQYSPLFTEAFIGFGQLGNYMASSKSPKYPGKVLKEYLVFGIAILLACPMIVIWPEYGWFIVTAFCVLGSYIFGVYIIVTANRVLRKGQMNE